MPISPLPDTTYTLVRVDAFIGYTMVFPYDAKSSENTVDGLMAWISLIGTHVAG